MNALRCCLWLGLGRDYGDSCRGRNINSHHNNTRKPPQLINLSPVAHSSMSRHQISFWSMTGLYRWMFIKWARPPRFLFPFMIQSPLAQTAWKPLMEKLSSGISVKTSWETLNYTHYSLWLQASTVSFPILFAREDSCSPIMREGRHSIRLLFSIILFHLSPWKSVILYL